MAKDDTLVNSLNKHLFQDGHKVNESYKLPSPTMKPNLSYMHPHNSPPNLQKAMQSVDKTLNESGRHSSQLSSAKTVFPTGIEKVRGAPKPISQGRAPKAVAIRPQPPKII